MPRITQGLFTDLAVWMLAFGLVLGLSFPFFVMALGFSAADVFTARFYAATITAGLAAGAVNYLLARLVVRPRLRLLARQTRLVESALRGAMFTGDWSTCTPSKCRVPADSSDEIGESARAFNDMVETLFRSHEFEAAVSEFSTALSQHLELEPLSVKALELLLNRTGALAGAVLIEETAGELTVGAAHGLLSAERLVRSSHVLRALESQSCRRIPFPRDMPLEVLLADLPPREALLVPLGFKEKPLGVVVLLTAAESFGSDVERLIYPFQQGFGLALNNALAHRQLQRLSTIDPLTNTYNRRFGLTRLREELNRAARNGSSLGVIMADIDHFKAINDTHGHLVGDRVLSSVANVLRAGLREGDILVRYGGEEFLIVLPGADASECHTLGNRLCTMAEETTIRDGDREIAVTLSLGITAYPQQAATRELDLIEEADAALYRAKESGRNRAILAI